MTQPREHDAPPHLAWETNPSALDSRLARLEEENAQLRQAVESHAVVDQALGVLMAVWRLPPTDGWDVLREVSQHLNTKLSSVAEHVIGWALGQPMPTQVRQELQERVSQRKGA